MTSAASTGSDLVAIMKTRWLRNSGYFKPGGIDKVQSFKQQSSQGKAR